MTAALALLLILAGDRPFVAICHAMADALDQRHLAGRRPRGAPGRAGSARSRMALFLLPAVSHRGIELQSRAAATGPRSRDPQIQLMLISVLGVTVLLFLRSFVGAAEIDRQDNLARGAAGDLGQPLHRAVVPDHHRVREPRLA